MSEQKPSEFSPNKSHPENIQVSIDKILGQPTTIKKVRKNQRDHTKVLFVKIIESIMYLNDRANILDMELDMDLTKYNSGFFDLIDNMLELHFNPEQLKLINFYMYDRYNDDGSVSPLINEAGAPIAFNTPEDLYVLISQLNK